jgi:hypothetical protein
MEKQEDISWAPKNLAVYEKDPIEVSYCCRCSANREGIPSLGLAGLAWADR